MIKLRFRDLPPHNDHKEQKNSESQLMTQTKPSFVARVLDYWVWEITSCVGALVALFAIIGVLLEYNGKSIPDWPYGITVNSVLSWIVQVFNACVLGAVSKCISQFKWIHLSKADRPLSDIDHYDSASRGPLGSITFIWRSKLRQLACLGALITILAVCVGPFTQQMVRVVNHRVITDIPASTARAQSYLESGSFTMTKQGGSQGPSSGMLATIYVSMFTNSNSSEYASTAPYTSVPPACPTGECEIPPFQSVAVCSHCEDVSLFLSSRCNEQCPEEMTLCTHSLPTAQARDPTKDMRIIANTEDFGESAFLNVTSIEKPRGANISHARALQCSLYWCVKTFSTSMHNGTKDEILLNTWNDPNAHFYPTPPSERLDIRPPRQGYLDASDFSIDGIGNQGLVVWFQEQFHVSTSFNTTQTDCQSIQNMSNIEQDFLTSDIFETLWYTNLPDLLSILSVRMTNYIRQVPLAKQYPLLATFGPIEGAGRANGTSYTGQTQIRVVWAWITFPALLILLTVAFLAITAIKTKRGRLEVWKSSTIPLLCSGLDEQSQQTIRAQGHLVQMNKMTDQLHVRLWKGDMGSYGNKWQLQAQ
ncbi:hypothetical protein BDV23DRAFT_168242 [Aspergillus alliaceus]|uniref:Uncharacterized protein n=1 Tax=Petromyces alliaceus TaxID=209559 RepID=A0A5N7CRY2_PETAA|nr:hypothetical protein BDV23DRAFT_168242 [Aspergillus alliaceus]